MKILMVHNKYQQYGGEDSVFAAEVRLLKSRDMDVAELTVSNEEIQGVVKQAESALGATYSWRGRRLVEQAIETHKPDVVHVQNWFPLISPSLFDACLTHRVPAVWTLHNYRIGCANGLLFRDGKPCELCLGKSPAPAIQHRCYRESRAGSAAVAAMLSYHQLAGTWKRKVNRYIALSEFSRQKYIQAGLPAERIAIKPNFSADPRPPGFQERPREGLLYVGRLSHEKGVHFLMEAAKSLPDVPITVMGSGPKEAELRAMAPPNVRFTGQVPLAQVGEAMASAKAVMITSMWYEAHPMVIVEAMAWGTPLIASRIGAMEHLITDYVTGRHFEACNPDDLARVVREALADPAKLALMGANARKEYEDRLTPDRSFATQMEIYAAAKADAAAAKR